MFGHLSKCHKVASYSPKYVSLRINEAKKVYVCVHILIIKAEKKAVREEITPIVFCFIDDMTEPISTKADTQTWADHICSVSFSKLINFLYYLYSHIFYTVSLCLPAPKYIHTVAIALNLAHCAIDKWNEQQNFTRGEVITLAHSILYDTQGKTRQYAIFLKDKVGVFPWWRGKSITPFFVLDLTL